MVWGLMDRICRHGDAPPEKMHACGLVTGSLQSGRIARAGPGGNAV